MVVNDSSFKVMDNGSLNVIHANGNSDTYQQQENGTVQYCLELVIEKCNYTSFIW